MDRELRPNGGRRLELKKSTSEKKYHKVTPSNGKTRKLVDALSELEEIYASLNLDDEDLLDRAERRDMPSKFQMMRLNPVAMDSDHEIINGREPRLHPEPMESPTHPSETGWTHPYCDEFFQNRNQSLGFVEALLSSSDPPNRYKTPARRRSAIPDPVHDDLAARKMVKSRNGSNKSTEDKKVQSYLLISPIYCPSKKLVSDTDSFSLENYLSTEPKPDIEKDDLSYRRFIQSDAACVAPAHPPFGIPIGPTTLTTINNYVQATLTDRDRNFFYYRVKPYYPHLVKDDMAFRSFRKDLDKTPEKSRKSCINGIKLLPVTTNHLINQRNEARSTRSRSSSEDSIGLNQVQLHYEPHHQYPIQSFVSSNFENQISSLV